MKRIILSNGVVRMMSYEDILKQFEAMIHQFANSAISKIVFNAPEKEEVMQELRIQTWEAYRRYNGINAFSTYLVPRLQHGVHRATQKLYAKKRTNKNGIESLNKLIGGENGENELADILGVEDTEMVSAAWRELTIHLEKTLTNDELKMLRVLIEKEDGYSVQDFADENKMSRQGANKKINKFKDKMAIIMTDSGYVEV